MIGKSAVVELVEEVLRDVEGASLTADQIDPLIETPKDSQHGDLAFPCFQLARALKKAPPAIAADLAAKISEKVGSKREVEKVVAVGPYVNFVLRKAALAEALVPAIVSGEFLKARSSTGERVMVEYANVNTHKSFHVGHIRNSVLGDVLARLLEWNGSTVVRSNYLGDEGTHVAKCLWYLLKHPEQKVPESNRLEFLGEAYSKATLQLDIGTYSRIEMTGIKTAKVEAITQHPNVPDWSVVTLQTEKGIICE
jgi:arginyl-tRNA synthetase